METPLLEPPHVLRTSRLTLHAIEVAHAAELVALIESSREHLARWIELPAPGADIVPRLASLANAAIAGTRVRYLVRKDGAAIGIVGLDVRPQTIAVTYWLGAGHTGCGYASEAAIRMCQLAFEHSRADELELRCDRENIASQRVARNLGFVHVADARGIQQWKARRDELPAWHRVRAIASRLRPVFVVGDRGVLRMISSDGAPLDITVRSVDGETYVAMISAIGGEGQFGPRAMLAHGSKLCVGSLVLDDREVCLRHSCAPDGLTVGCVRQIHDEAVRLRALAPRASICTNAFAFAL